MTTKEYYLGKIAEECCEVAQRVHKILHFGMHEVQPEQLLTNEERLVEEIDDLRACIILCQNKGILISPMLEERVQAKFKKVDKYLQYAKSIGTVTE